MSNVEPNAVSNYDRLADDPDDALHLVVEILNQMVKCPSGDATVSKIEAILRDRRPLAIYQYGTGNGEGIYVIASKGLAVTTLNWHLRSFFGDVRHEGPRYIGIVRRKELQGILSPEKV